MIRISGSDFEKQINPPLSQYQVTWYTVREYGYQWENFGRWKLPCHYKSVQFGSVAQSCLTLCYLMDCSTPSLPVHCQLLELAQNHVRQVSDAIQPFHILLSPSPPAFNLSQHQGLFKWVSSSHQVVKGSEFQLQHQSFQWICRVDFL